MPPSRDSKLQAALVALRDALGEAGSPWMVNRSAPGGRGLRIAMDLEPVIEPIAIEMLVPALARHGIALGPTRTVNATAGAPAAPVVRATHEATGVELELVLRDKLSGLVRRHLARQHGPRWQAEFRRAIRARGVG